MKRTVVIAGSVAALMGLAVPAYAITANDCTALRGTVERADSNPLCVIPLDNPFACIDAGGFPTRGQDECVFVIDPAVPAQPSPVVDPALPAQPSPAVDPAVPAQPSPEVDPAVPAQPSPVIPA